MRVLIIEDELDLLNSVRQYLSSEGHVCAAASSYNEARQALLKGSFDGVVLDLNLPDGDGFNLIREIQKLQESIVIITSARNSLEERISGLNAGADDYLVKPFHLAELSSRLKAIFRRKHFAGKNVLQFDSIAIDLDAREVHVDHMRLKLTRTEFDILSYLARNKNKVVTKSTLVEHVWGDHMEDSFSLDFVYSHMKNLRKKLSDLGVGDCITSVYGLGYKFSA